MKNIISAGTCGAMVAAAAISLMAQPPSPQTTTPTPQTPQTTTQAPQTPANSSADKRITVTGCLKPEPTATDTASAPTGTAGTTGTTAPAATDAAGATFILADAAPAVSTTATTNAPAQTYRLIANSTALAPHVGKKLELTGTIVDESAASASSTTSNPASSGSGPVLRVETGKVIAASCQN